MNLTAEQRITRDRLQTEFRKLATEVMDYWDSVEPDDRQRIPNEFIFILGARYIGDDGAMGGTVYCFVDEESMPGYLARGLIEEARDSLREMP